MQQKKMDNMSRMIVMLPALEADKVIYPKYYKHCSAQPFGQVKMGWFHEVKPKILNSKAI